jgi:hypothetical protein
MTTLASFQRVDDQKALSLTVYCPEDKKAWNDFIAESKNGTFLLNRNYMDYHSDRFTDHSLMFHYNGQLAAVLPANQKDGVLFSHGGLTFGGVISGYDMSTPLMLEIFQKIREHCTSEGYSKLLYKAIPHIYHAVPAEEDLYALFRNKAKLVGRNVSSTILLTEKRRFTKKKREAITKAKNNGLIVKQSSDFFGFMRLVEEVIAEHHGAKPVHTPQEMDLLANRFPENIKLFYSYKDDKVVAGCLIYESKNVAHGQYAANSTYGRTLCAQDLIIDYLINEYYTSKEYFDFGTSTLDMGRILNEGLIAHKESFRASATVYDTYELPITEK